MTNDFKVVFDIRMLRHSGIGTYIRGLLEGMSYLPDAPKFIFLGPHRYRCEAPERLCELYVVRDFPIYSWQEQILFPERLRFQTLFHAPHYNIPLRFRGKLVVSIHDLNHLEFSKNLPTPLHRLYARYMFGEAAARARLGTVGRFGRRRARNDMKQSNLERQVEALMFEKKNRKVLSQYPEADADLEKIMKASQTSGMTVEQVCRGLYGNVRTEKELRALSALTDDSDDSEVNDSVSRGMRSAKPNTKKASLTPEQQAVKRKIDLLAKKNGVKPPTNEEFLASIYE